MMLATTFSNLSGMLFCNSSKKPGRTSQAIVTAGTEDRNPDRKISARPAVDISDRVEAVSLKGRRVLGKIAGMATHQAHGGVQRPTGITRRVYRAQYIDCQQDSEYAEGAGGSNRRVERWRLAQAKLVQPFDLL